MNAYVKLARDTINKYLNGDGLPKTDDLPKELLEKKAGCFVSLHNKKDGELRGCIGTILPVYKNLAGEIIHNAIEAAFHDPRFQPVTENEINNLDISIDILSEPEPIPSEKSLNPKKYGVIAKSHDGRTGLLLPDIEDVDDASYQVAIARKKAGIDVNEPIFLYRFSVTRHKE